VALERTPEVVRIQARMRVVVATKQNSTLEIPAWKNRNH